MNILDEKKCRTIYCLLYLFSVLRFREVLDGILELRALSLTWFVGDKLYIRYLFKSLGLQTPCVYNKETLSGD